jgi:hypothetical protein
MSNRSWFFASQGQQQGPYQEAQLHGFIAAGTVTAETLVWTEGMAGWQKAGDIPGLFAGGPPAIPGSGPLSVGAVPSGGSLSINFGIWDFIWRSVVLLIGVVLIIPLPWVVVMYLRWIVSSIHVPDRPNLTFTGRSLTVLWWYLGAIVLFIGVALTGILLNTLMIFVQFALYWLAIRWFVANLASNGQPLGLSFSGSYWAYLGWNILAALSFITIIGWAWVYTAQMRWICRNIHGTRREIVFKASGLQYLWRAVAAALASAFIIPIPWMFRWMMRWHASQIVLVNRGGSAAA